jgi:hypothetical protein
VFDFKRVGPHVEIAVQQGLSHLKAVKCGTAFAVAGTTVADEIVLGTEHGKPMPDRPPLGFG